MKSIGPMLPSHDQGAAAAPAEVQDDFGGIAVEAPPVAAPPEVADDFGGIPAAPPVAEPPAGEPLPRRAIVPDRTPRVPEWVKADPSYQRRAEILGFLERNTKLNPQEAHEAARISAAGGGDINYVAENLATLRPLYTGKTQEEWEALAANAPGTADFLTTDPATFAMARAESERLSGIEWALTGRWDTEIVDFGNGPTEAAKWTAPFWAEALGDEVRRQELIFRQTAALATRPSEEVEVQQRLLSALAIAHEQGIDARAGDEVWIPIYARVGLQKTPEGEFRVLEGSFPPAPTQGDVENAARIEELRVATAPKDYGPFERTVAGKFVFAPFRLAPMMGGATLSAGAGGLAAGPAGAIGGGVSWWTFQNYAPLAEQLAMEVGPDGQKLTADQASEQALAWSLFSSVLMEAGVTPLLANLPGAGQVFQRAMARAPAAALASPSLAKRVVTAVARAGKHTVTGAAGAAAQAAANATAVEIARASLDPERGLDLSSYANISNATTEAFETAMVDMLAFGLLGAGRTLLQDRGLRLAALDSRERLRAMTDRAAESELLRSVPPERTAELVQSIKTAAGLAPDAVVDTVYADRAGWDRYWQEQKIDPRAMAAEVMGDGGRAYDQAVSTRAAALPIPVEAYLSKLAAAKNGEHARGLAPDLTLDPEVNTPRQEAAEATLRNQRTRELAKLPPDKMEADQRQVFEAYRDQALAAREAADVADANAATFSASLKVLAERAGRGETAWDLWKEHPVNITSERGRRSEERGLYAQALAEWDLHPAGRALAWLRGGEAKAPTTGADTPSASPFDAIAAQLREKAVALGKAAVPEAVTAKIEKVRAKIAALEEKSTGKTTWRSDQALGRPSATKSAEIVMFPDPETGTPAWGLAGAEGVAEGGKTHAVRLPSWLEADDFLAHRKAWEWTWAALGGPDAPEQAQKLVFGYMRPSLEDLPEVSKYGIQQGYSVARLTQGKGGRAYESTREALERWANEPEATRAEDPVDPRAWGGLLTATRTNKEAVARGKFINFKNVDAFGKWFETTSREIDEARPFYESRPPEWYGKPGEAPEAPPAAGKEGERAAALRQELAKLEAEAREAALKGAKESRKLDFEETTRILGKDAEKLPTEPGGIKPSELADALGVASADVLLRDMVEMADRSKWAKREAGLRMVKREPARSPEVLVQERLAEVDRRLAELSVDERLEGVLAVLPDDAARARETFRDPITGLPNAAEFGLRKPGADEEVVQVSFEGLKWFQDHFQDAHPAGDALYREIATVLHQVNPSVAKVGGDFGVILPKGKVEEFVRAANEALPEHLKWARITAASGTTWAAANAAHRGLKTSMADRAPAGTQPKAFPEGKTREDVRALLKAGPVDAALPAGAAATVRLTYRRPESGLLSQKGRDALSDPKALQLHADADGVGVSDLVSPGLADAVTRKIGELYRVLDPAESLLGNHIGSDEYGAEHRDQGTLESFRDRLKDLAASATITYIDEATGQKYVQRGIGISFGIGVDHASAEAALQADKAERARRGERDRTGLPRDQSVVARSRISVERASVDEVAAARREREARAHSGGDVRRGDLGARDLGGGERAPDPRGGREARDLPAQRPARAEVASLLRERAQLRGQLGLRFEQRARAVTSTPEFKAWFGDSKVVDAAGAPLRVFHGASQVIEVFNRKASAASEQGIPHVNEVGSWFTTGRSDAKFFGPRVASVFLSVSNPAVVEGWAGLEALAKKAGAELGAKRYGPGRMDGEKLRAWLKRQGHDGIKIIGGEDSVAGLDYWVALDPQQIKSATGNRGTFDPSNPNILFQAKRAAKQATEKNLLVQHNLTGENLVHADELGGLAVPSIAISRAEAPLNTFGEVTLLAPKEMVDPKRGVPVFDRDVWSQRWPDTRWMINGKAWRSVAEKIRAGADKVKAYLDDAPDELSRRGVEETLQRADWRASFALRYLEEKGKPIADINEDVPLQRVDVLRQPAMQAFLREHGVSRDFQDGDAYHRALTAAYKKGVNELIADAGVTGRAAKLLRDSFESDVLWFRNEREEVSVYDEKTGLLDQRTSDDVVGELGKYGKKQIDSTAMQEAALAAVASPGVKADFETWVRKELAPVFGERVIVTQRAGSWVKKAYTLENIVAHMKKGRVQQAEGGGGVLSGFGHLLAGAARRYSSLEAIQRDRSVLRPAQETKDARDALSNRVAEMVSQLRPFHAPSSDDRAGFRAFDAFLGALSEGFKRGKDVAAELRAEGFSDVPAEVLGKVRDLMQAIRDLPDDIFEAKPQRAVGIQEFQAAVIPDDAGPEVRKALKRHGLDVVEYPKGDEAARQRVIAETAARHQLLFQEGNLTARFHVEQPPKKGTAPRGYVDLAPWGASAGTPHRIHLADSDRSTLAHESFHVLSRVFGEVAMREDAPAALRADYEGFLKAIGYASHAERAASADAKREEKATHLWEAFLAEGKAPSQELLPAFARFRAWMKRIYQGVKGVADQYRQTYGEELALSDDVRGIFQRLLAGDAAVADASKAVEAEAPKVHLTPEEQAESDRLRALARAEAEARLQRVLVEEDRKADRAFMKEARAKVTEQVEAEVAKEKAYSAIDALEKGDVAGAALKLDRDAVVAAFGEDVAARLPKGVFGKDGAPPEVVAEALAYGSAADLVLGLANAPKRSDRVREVVAERMAELFPSLEERPAAIVVAAADAVNGDALLREGLVRLRAMAREAGIRPRITDLEALKEAAQAAVSQRTVSELHPERFEVAAKGFARQAAHLKTPEARLDAYEAYLFNRAVHRAARDAQERADKSAAFLAKYQRPAGRAKVGKAQETGEDGRISQPYLNAIDELLATVEFGASKTLKEVHGREARLADLERWVQERWADGDSVIIPPATLSALRRTRHWKDLTVSELDGLVDAVKSIATQAELRTKFEVGGQKIEMSRVVEELRQAAVANGAKVPQTFVPANRPAGEKAKELGRQALHMVERPEVLFDYLDGFDPEGPWKKYVWNVLSDASYRYYDLVRSTNETIQKLLRELPAEERRRIKETRFEVEGQPYTLENAIVVGLNAGNDSNLGKLAKGMSDPRIQENYGIQPWQGRASIDAFLAQLMAKDVEIINAIHKALESYWPESEALEKRDVGIAPPKVPTRPLRFRGKDGAELVIEGGYYPLIYSRLYRVGKTQAEADALAMNGLPGLFSPTYDRAMTPQGHLQERIEAFARPFDLTLDALPRKLTMTAKDIAFRLPAKQIYRSLMDERISGALAQALGDRGHDLVMGHLKDAVNDVMLPDVGAHLALRLINRARALTYQSTFALNVPQTLQNLADVAGVQAVVPRRYFMDAALDLARERGRWVEKILADSPEMRIRMDGLSKSLVRDMESTFRRSEIALKWEHAQELMLLPFETTQKMTEFPTYLASYRHALTPKEKGGLGLDHAGAVRHAEGAVRTMYGGKRTIDLTPIQRDKVMRHFTMFWGWASAQLNQFIAASGKSRRAWNEGMRLRAFKIVGSAFAALWAKQLASEVLVGRGPKDEDEDGDVGADDWARWVAFRGVMTLPSFVPVVSSVARGVEADTQRDVSLTPWLNLLNAGVKSMRKTASTVEDAVAGEVEEDAEIDLFLMWLEAGGQLTGAPVSQVRRTVGYWADRPGDAAVGEDVLGTAFGPSRPGKLSETLFGR